MFLATCVVYCSEGCIDDVLSTIRDNACIFSMENKDCSIDIEPDYDNDKITVKFLQLNELVN